MSPELKIINNAITQATNDGLFLLKANYQLRNNKDVVMAAVKNKGYALEYASKQLQMIKIL